MVPRTSKVVVVIAGGVLALWGLDLFAAARPVSDPGVPPARAHHQLVYHPEQDAVYLVGGSTRAEDGYHYFDDVWRWSGTEWIAQAPLPFPRASHRMTWSPRRNALLLFGGQFDRAVRAEGIVWALGEGGWRAVGGHFRAGRDEPSVCWDRERNHLVIYGGWDSAAQYRSETWEWDGERMTHVEVEGPSARAGAGFAWDERGRRCILFGGRGEDGYLGETWAWDGKVWAQLDVQGPSPRGFVGFTEDLATDGIVMFGGSGPDGDLGDTWIWDGASWIAGPREGPQPRGLPGFAATGRGILLFGGRSVHEGGFTDFGDTWVLEEGRWRRIGAGPPHAQ